MKKLTKLIALFVMLCSSAYAVAQISSEPIITIHTNLYQVKGAGTQLSFVIGTTDSTYIYVDNGDGMVEYDVVPAVYNSETQEVEGTTISCLATEEGVIKVYGDASMVDYLSARGNYISKIEFPSLNLDVLDLSHNELRELDLTNMTNLTALYVGDNTYSAEKPLLIGGNKPNLQILEMSIVEHLDQSFNLSDYPKLVSFDAYHNVGLRKLDPTNCPNLLRLTLDVTNVETLDVSKNTNLMVLNISNTKITSIDVSMLPYLTEFYCTNAGSFNNEYKLDTLDVTNNPELQYFFCSNNNLKNIDLSKNTKLVTFVARNNYLESLDVSANEALYIVDIENNCLDYATLPFDPGVWNTYNYGQRNFPVEKSYKEGVKFDYSDRVLREGTITDAVLYTVSESSPESPTILDASYYTYANGVFTINKATEDSVYIAFGNDVFTGATLRTDKFIVKTAEEYGKKVEKFSFTTGIQLNKEVAFGLGVMSASVDNPKEVYVDFGSNKCDTIVVTTENPDVNNIVGKRSGWGPVVVYVPEGELVWSIKCDNVPMTSVDVSKIAEMRHLQLSNAGLYSVDLRQNRCLLSLDLSGNNLSTLSLSADNQYYYKNILHDINLSNNKLTSLTLNNLLVITDLNLSNNQLSDMDFTDTDNLKTADLSNNQFTELSFMYASSLTDLNVANNNLTSIILPETNNIKTFNCSGNQFTLATLPKHGNLTEEAYIYAPQADLVVATKGPGIDLTEQYLTIDGASTEYVWKDANGNELVNGVDYTCDKGMIKFLNIEVGKIYCEMSHAKYPAFNGKNVFKTTKIEAAAPPTNVIASFTTVNDGDAVLLSLAAAENGIAIYFDWSGDGNLTQYMLGTTYRLFNATTKALANVKVYTYEPTEKITVFSMSGAALSSFDGSKLTDAINISVNGGGLSEIKLPENPTVLSELSLQDNAFTSFDLSKYPQLTMANLTGNKLTGLDLTQNKNLQVFSAAENQLTEIKMANDAIWSLYLDYNLFDEIDLSGVKNLQQLSISYNNLSSIDISALSQLRVLLINNNCFTFKTLPLSSLLNVYYYQNQAPINVVCSADGKVDLSEQAMVGNTESVYTWYLDVPVYNDYGELEGEALFVDYEYTIENGVTTFLKDFTNVMCVITNAMFPNVYMYTNQLDAVAGIEDVKADENGVNVNVIGHDIIVSSTEKSQVALYSLNGALLRVEDMNGTGAVISNVDSGIYIVKVGADAVKVAIK